MKYSDFLPHIVLLILFACLSAYCVQIRPCRDLNGAFARFAAQNRYCEQDEDCILIGVGSCNCVSIPNNAISKSAAQAALPFEERFRSCRNSDSYPCYDDPVPYFASTAQCINKQCQPIQDTCGNSADR